MQVNNILRSPSYQSNNRKNESALNSVRTTGRRRESGNIASGIYFGHSEFVPCDGSAAAAEHHLLFHKRFAWRFPGALPRLAQAGVDSWTWPSFALFFW